MSGIVNVLIVDDSGYMRTVIRKYLEQQGMVIAAEAANGIEAIELYEKHKPTIVTMDISMKKLGGIEATKSIRQLDPNAKIIMISALGEARFIKEAIQSGAADFIIKPFEPERLVSSIQSVLNRP